MNRYLSLLLLINVAIVYGQNPAAYLAGRNLVGREMFYRVRSSYDEKFAAQLRDANREYERLSIAEKELCDLVGMNLAVMHACELLHVENKPDLIPEEINPKQDIDLLIATFAKAKKNAEVSDDRLAHINQIGYVRLSAKWKRKADLVNKPCTWNLVPNDDAGEDISD
jgi:hypothetical protein